MKADLRVRTLGGFGVWRAGAEIAPAAWGREKALHLFQLFVTLRRRQLRKEEIVELLWPELDEAQGDRDFKVALHALHHALEPARPARAEPRFIRRQELTYGLRVEGVRVDVDDFDAAVAAGNQALPAEPATAIAHFRRAAAAYAGEYLPDRRYDDWSSAERERLLTVALATTTALASLLLDVNPTESLQHTQRVLALEPAWEDAYRIQMKAHLALGNRAMALRTYQQCEQALQREMGVAPLPETQRLHAQARGG